MTTVNSSITRALASAIPALFIFESGIVKIVGISPVIPEITKAGMADLVIPLGIVESLLAIFFMIGKTMRFALIGLTCYFSGAIAAEISHGSSGVFPLIVLILVWVSALVRD